MSGLTASFTDTSTDAGGTIGAYAWTFGDGSTSTVRDSVHTYTLAGTFPVTETITDAVSGRTSSKTLSIVLQGTPPVLPVANGGFESGSTGWTASTGVICTDSGCSGETAHTGTGFAWLDGYGSAHADTLSQSVKIPTGYTKATLQFWLHVDTAETTKSAADDELTIAVTSGSTTTTLGTYSNLNAGSGYVLRSLDVTPFIGKSITLKFTGTENASRKTSFVLDDIQIAMQ